MKKFVRRKIKRKMILKIFWIGVLLIGTLIIFCTVVIKQYSSKYTFDNVEDIPYRKTALLLGTSPTLSDGSPNLYFENRIQAASELYKAGKIKYIIASGDNHTKSYNEPEEMIEALRRKGIPENVMFADYAGFRTLDSVVRAKEIFGQDSLIIISQRFHNERAIFLASRYDIKATGYNAKDVAKAAGFKTNVRELFARVKVFADLLFGKKPKFLGEPIELP